MVPTFKKTFLIDTIESKTSLNLVNLAPKFLNLGGCCGLEVAPVHGARAAWVPILPTLFSTNSGEINRSQKMKSTWKHSEQNYGEA